MRRTVLAVMVMAGGLLYPYPEARADRAFVSQAFEALDSNFRRLRLHLDEPGRRYDNLELLGNIQRLARHAREMEPLEAHDLVPEKREAFVGRYRKRMDSLLVLLRRAGVAIRRGERKEAARLLDAIERLRDKAHREFKVN